MIEQDEDIRTIDLSDISAGFVYIRNYMLHRYGEALEFDLVLNAMSLPEMRPAQIEYYADLIRMTTEAREGVFVDFNSHAEMGNPIIDNALAKTLPYCHQFNFEDLGNTARIWSTSASAITAIRDGSATYARAYDLDAAFRFDRTKQSPELGKAQLCDLMNRDIGDYLGVEFKEWMGRRGYEFADHLALYRKRLAEKGKREFPQA